MWRSALLRSAFFLLSDFRRKYLYGRLGQTLVGACLGELFCFYVRIFVLSGLSNGQVVLIGCYTFAEGSFSLGLVRSSFRTCIDPG